MAKIKNIEGLTNDDINAEIKNGGSFVIYTYTISIIVMTFKRSSHIYFIRADDSNLTKGIPFSIITFFLGWWGFPWGPIYSIGSLVTNLSGGKDVTYEVNSFLQGQGESFETLHDFE